MKNLVSKIKEALINIDTELVEGNPKYKIPLMLGVATTLGLTLIDPGNSNLMMDIKPYAGGATLGMLSYMGTLPQRGNS